MCTAHVLPLAFHPWVPGWSHHLAAVDDKEDVLRAANLASLLYIPKWGSSSFLTILAPMVSKRLSFYFHQQCTCTGLFPPAFLPMFVDGCLDVLCCEWDEIRISVWFTLAFPWWLRVSSISHVCVGLLCFFWKLSIWLICPFIGLIICSFDI